MNQKGFANIILVLVIVAVIAIGGYFVVVKKQPQPTTQTPVQTTIPTPIETSTQTPPATTPSIQTNVNNEWKIFKDSRYTFQFSYPGKWNVTNQQGTSRVLILKDEMSNEIITVDTGVNLSVIGISYCGAYPQDKRCESLKTESGGYVTIDWDESGTANAMFSSQDGTYGVSFTLHKVSADTKVTFRKILSTFLFIK